MAEDENKETSEETPVDETPEAEETPAAPGSEAEEAAAKGENPSPSADDDPSLTPSEEAEGPAEEADTAAAGPAEEAPAEVAEAPAEDAEGPADEAQGDPAEAPADEPKGEKKKDVIPGADLEPIAVDSGEERPLSAEERARREAEEEERAQREAELVGDGAEEESSAASRAPAKLEKDSRYQATGKRKRSIARVTLLPGDGKFEINGRTIEEFFPRPLHQTMAKQPLATTGYETSVDVRIRVHGGGIGGQAGAVRHGISRALTEIDPELRGELKRRGFLTRDARVKERRKAGLKKARKKPQFSKR
jgi:small subunit ribosomal protein S9